MPKSSGRKNGQPSWVDTKQLENIPRNCRSIKFKSRERKNQTLFELVTDLFLTKQLCNKLTNWGFYDCSTNIYSKSLSHVILGLFLNFQNYLWYLIVFNFEFLNDLRVCKILEISFSTWIIYSWKKVINYATLSVSNCDERDEKRWPESAVMPLG